MVHVKGVTEFMDHYVANEIGGEEKEFVIEADRSIG